LHASLPDWLDENVIVRIFVNLFSFCFIDPMLLFMPFCFSAFTLYSCYLVGGGGCSTANRNSDFLAGPEGSERKTSKIKTR
jgi:hypothetical protein